ncbi:hypothetical protein LY78DRAFT_662894 [Colletotrichum sublineola]|uniref:Uncharacterized protein n=1 Tax=Colletotrichum sublineola TaxID=1173701 RepID=A0A066XKC5_COLSU|nr:hypothetical protein LY78DRAFT_662894 [Colletotrichum sublineola]KDN69372.1 putative conserved hypothetical protein [Colletotrichum sublineola]
MAPFAQSVMPRGITFNPSAPLGQFRAQWATPGDVFSVLLILGGDVVGRALAQLAGSGFTPVSFSFGWVAYSVMALVSAVGENKLMPSDSDCKCKVINGRTGYGRDNSSWILGRIMRDFGYWRHEDVQAKLDEVLEAKRKAGKMTKRPPMAGLIVSVYEASSVSTAGEVQRDHVYWIGFPVMLLQLGIAAIPCGLFGDWSVLLITAAGILLSVSTGLLPQWKKEKWACRKKSSGKYIITRGNGAQHAIVILGRGRGFDLEDLASGQANILVVANTTTRLALLVLSALWILLLVTAAGVQENTWFLLVVGAVGILQNVYVAGARRRPESFGIPLEFVEVLGQPQVMNTLLEVERKYKHVGRAMLGEFFPGKLTSAEEEMWDTIHSTNPSNEKEADEAKTFRLSE